MLAKITLYDGTIYRIADKTTDTEDGIYLGRIKDELSLVSAMQEAGNAPATINLTIINDDDFIPHSKDLWAAEVLLTNDNGVSWRGKINFCNFDSDGNLYVTASEKTAPELELQLPDEVRQVYTVDEDFHQSSVTMTIPLVIGGTTSNPILLSTILIDKTEGVYLICVGEIRSIVKVYNGTEELPNTAYTAYTGTANQEENAGFAYVQIAEDYRLNSDGSYAEINVDVVGLKLGNHTEAECRNGARFLYYFLTTAATGVNGWGCGIDSNLIDSNSFNSAITLCDQLGYKLDGIMWLRQSAQSWIDQICQAIHGKYSINANGKRSLFIDYAGNASKKTFTSSNMRVEKYGKNSYTSVVYNKGILSYDYNPITGLFMQSAQYENAESIAQIGEQKFVGESYMLKDPTTALAVLEYTCKRSQTAAEAIEFKTDDINTLLRAGDVITINRPDLSINNALYQIQNISITDYEASISAVKFDTSVFSVTGTASTVNWGSEKAITPALTPAQATNLLLSTGFDINPDGTGTPYISGAFTVPEGGWLAAAVQYGIGADPTNWTELALITEGKFKLSPVNVGTAYSIRVRMITSTGHSDYITGQITATGDSTPPLAPTITAKATDKTVTVQCGLDNPPYDMGGFQIYRKKSTEQVYTLIGSVAANRGYASITDYVDEYVTYNYQAKSYDRSGNLSTNFSNVASVTVTGIQANDVAATALAMPTGSILRLSAKNCTTASIAEANGVKDVSGNGNHGKAQNGVAVVHDEVLGDCFSFSGSNQIINLASRISTIFTQGNAYTFSVRFKLRAKPTRSNGILIFWCYQRPNIQIWLNSAYKIRIDTDNGFGKVVTNITAEIGVPYTVTVSVDYLNGLRKIFVNGEEVDSANKTGAALNVSVNYLYVGNHTATGYDIDGFISDVRIYPRALSASEIKTIYMFPDDVTFGQLTADLIGANIIKASNLVLTENIITQTAQIKDAIITNAKISDLNASKINAGTLDAARIAANAITAEKLNVEATKIPSGCTCHLSAEGYGDQIQNIKTLADLTVIGDLTSYGNWARTRNAVTANHGGDGFYFNLKGGFLDFQSRFPLPTSCQMFTIAAWVYQTAHSSVHLYCDYGSSTNESRLLCHSLNPNTDKYEFYVGSGSSSWTRVTYNKSDIPLNQWFHLAFVFRGGISASVYKNGVLLASVTSGVPAYGTGTSHSSNNYIGRFNSDYAPNNPFLGEIMFFNRILSVDEIMRVYKNGRSSGQGQITADRLVAGCVETRHLTADAIVGKTFQTASNTGTSNAAGVRFNSSGIQGFNGSSKTFDLSTNGKLTCSDVDLTGKITASSGKIGDFTISNGVLTYSGSKYSQTSGIVSVTSTYGTITDVATLSGSMIKFTSTSVTQVGALSAGHMGVGYNNDARYASFTASGGGSSGDYGGAIGVIQAANSNCFGLYVIGKIRANSTDYGSDEKTKKDFKTINVLDKLKGLNVCAWRFDEEKLIEKQNKDIDKRNIEIEAENKVIDAENAEIEKENELRKNRKDGEPVELIPLKEHKKLREHRIADKNANHPLNIGCMAGEFNKAFGTNDGSEDCLSVTDVVGVCMRAIQELAEISDTQKAEIDELKAKLKIQQDEKSEIIEHFNELTKEPTGEDELVEPSFDELLKNGENQQDEQK